MDFTLIKITEVMYHVLFKKIHSNHKNQDQKDSGIQYFYVQVIFIAILYWNIINSMLLTTINVVMVTSESHAVINSRAAMLGLHHLQLPW